jgi:hypothetical protein
MNKLGLRPSTILKKAQPTDSRRVRKTAKIISATLAALFALGGTVGICLIAFSAIKARTSAPKGTADVPVLPAVEASPAAISPTPAGKYEGVVIQQPANQAHNDEVVADHSPPAQTSTPALSPTPAAEAIAQNDQKPSVNDREFLDSKQSSAESKNPDKQLSGAERRNLEKVRRQAERKRSRLEEMYQKHEISSDAYKKGEEEYKSAIEKYRSAVSSGR